MDELQREADLVGKALAGDEDAFVALCDRHRRRVWRIVSSLAPGPDADDLAQETVIRAFRALPTYRGEASFAAWLCRIALHAAQDYRRSAWRRRVVLWETDPTAHGPLSECLSDLAERRETQRRVRQAVAALPPKQRVPIWLHYFEGFSLAEVARLEHVPENTVRSRVQAGSKRLLLPLKDLLEETSEGRPVHCTTGAKRCGA